MAFALVVSILSGCARASVPAAAPARPAEISTDPLVEAALVRESAALDIRAWRFETAKERLDRVLTRAPNDPIAHLYYGELYRLQAQRVRRLEDSAPLLAQARQSYERAAALDSGYAEPFRQLGLLYYQSKEMEKAKEAFRKYLTLKPDAPDARRVKEYLVELDR
ncbi:MAG TPA: tetratricopeptide repeat protein [Methylomirabilota bacterium]|nr:tetratricopeptide repeat protein [Methylomirabilota bacterium]